MKKLKRALLYSSANPEKIAITVKAGVPLILTILTASGLATLHTSVEELTGLIGDFVFNAVQVISLIGTVYGIGRKIVLAFKR